MEFNATFLATIITFVIFVFLMNKVLYKPMAEIVAKRQDALTEERKEKLGNAKNEARGRYNQTIAEYKDKKSNLVKNVQDETEAELAQAYENLNNLSNETKEGLKAGMTDLANDIVEKMLGYRSEVQGFDNDMVNRILYH